MAYPTIPTRINRRIMRPARRSIWARLWRFITSAKLRL